jgi:ABC-2 type transport system ATP-binding protein
MKSLLSKLDVETFVLDLREPLRETPRLDHMEIAMPDEHTLEVTMGRQRSLNAVFAELDQLGIHVTSMRNKANRLEELFMRLVDKGSTT